MLIRDRRDQVLMEMVACLESGMNGLQLSIWLLFSLLLLLSLII